MELEHSFTVPAAVDTVWSTMMDLQRVAECFPGATITSVEGDSFEGTCKVKLGPIAMVYKGNGSFVEQDDAAHRAVIEAKGRDKRGNGTAGATVTMAMSSLDASSTRVDVSTDLNITGKPAQFGRGVMQDVSDKLLGQFVECLAGQFGDQHPLDDVATAPAAGPPTPSPTAPGTVERDGSAEPETRTAPHPDVAPVRGRPPKDSDQPLDLAATVLPALVRGYLPCVVAGVLGLLLGWVLGRRGAAGR